MPKCSNNAVRIDAPDTCFGRIAALAAERDDAEKQCDVALDYCETFKAETTKLGVVVILLEQIIDMNGGFDQVFRGLPVSKFNGPLRKALAVAMGD